jgi:hypothetical protein
MQTDAETQGATEGSGLADSGILISVIMQVGNFTGRKMRAFACVYAMQQAANDPIVLRHACTRLLLALLPW